MTLEELSATVKGLDRINVGCGMYEVDLSAIQWVRDQHPGLGAADPRRWGRALALWRGSQVADSRAGHRGRGGSRADRTPVADPGRTGARHR
jgi:hypothetical protein